MDFKYVNTIIMNSILQDYYNNKICLNIFVRFID